MKKLYRIVRSVLVVCLLLAFVVPATLYVLLSIPSIQQNICERVEGELSRVLNTPVSIRAIALSPFNRATLLDVSVLDAKGDTCLQVKRLGTAVNLRHLAHRKLVFNYGEIIGLNARITRDSIGAPLNIQHIINALQPRDKTKPPSRFEFAINTVVVRTSSVSYDILNQPRAAAGHFDPSHISLHDLRADISLPHLANDDLTIDVRRLAMSERSGLTLKRLSALVHMGSGYISISEPVVELARSRILINNQLINLKAPRESYHIKILDGSHIATNDIVPLLPQLENLNMSVAFDADIEGTERAVAVKALNIADTDNGLRIALQGEVDGIGKGDKPAFDFPSIDMECRGAVIADVINRFTTLPALPGRMLANMGDASIKGSYSGTATEGTANLTIAGAPGTIGVDGTFHRHGKGSLSIDGTLGTEGFDCSQLLAGTGHALEQFGPSALKSEFNVTISHNRPEGHIDLSMPLLTYRGHSYTDLLASADIEGHDYSGFIAIDNPGIKLNVDVDASLGETLKSLQFDLDADNLDLMALNLVGNTGGKRLSLKGQGSLEGPDIDHVNGTVHFTDIEYTDAHDRGLRIANVNINATSTPANSHIDLTSDVADGRIDGVWSWGSLIKDCRTIVERVFPNLTGQAGVTAGNGQSKQEATNNELTFALTVKNTEPVEQLLKLPVSVIHPVTMTGGISSGRSTISLNVDAPYLLQGKKVIEGTVLRMNLDAGGDSPIGRANLYATTMLPTKNGPMTLAANAFGSDGQLDTQLSWHVNRAARYNGDVSLTTRFDRLADHTLSTHINVNPSQMVINDTIWQIAPSQIDIAGKRVSVDDFRVGRPGQSISMNGTVSTSADDVLFLSLSSIDLDYIFETLGIEAAMFGGCATGDFYISQAFTPSPIAYTPLLKVKGLKYNHSLMGDAEIESSWEPGRKAVKIDAAIHQANGGISYIDGRIMPMCDSLDFNFDADRVPIGFLQPFMSAFATDVSGYASGKARLWGTFKLIDMVGDVYGEDVSISLGFTGTTYTTTDTVHLRPGRIDLPQMTIKDKFGHTAHLSGWLTHNFFKTPSFKFMVTDARDLLVYDINERQNERWYGTVFGNGRATVSGRPGYVNIDVDVSTAPKSTFTFVLTDAMQASDYNFITFRDTGRNRRDSIDATTAEPPAVSRIRERYASSSDNSTGSIYDMSIRVDVNPNALVTLVMDPVGGDRIVARGNGNMRLTYDSANEDLRMFGAYTLVQGNYNFTLQDIIIKDFTIEDGSKITFNGNPYAAQLDIKAAYAVNANLSDLDESFLQDKDLNRTNVPVHAMLLVSGDMRQPEIRYDLSFPTLTSDVYRKVRSIVNTDEMMQRQIIYLLMLNRFYTPDYMSATKGNELVSVASSTISSQLSNILGQLSDKWSISPNFRSDRGDFSDVEVDLALSSHLLNNRLLLNGNFGYRDKALNNNSFIGDFDIEYLLNRMGTIRLKAYNRYNDQNYYLKSALTTQGVGVVFKRDFDNVFSFLRPLFRRKKKDTVTRTDSATMTPAAGAPADSTDFLQFR